MQGRQSMARVNRISVLLLLEGDVLSPDYLLANATLAAALQPTAYVQNPVSFELIWPKPGS
jgi:hypothetical protein